MHAAQSIDPTQRITIDAPRHFQTAKPVADALTHCAGHGLASSESSLTVIYPDRVKHRLFPRAMTVGPRGFFGAFLQGHSHRTEAGDIETPLMLCATDPECILKPDDKLIRKAYRDLRRAATHVDAADLAILRYFCLGAITSDLIEKVAPKYAGDMLREGKLVVDSDDLLDVLFPSVNTLFHAVEPMIDSAPVGPTAAKRFLQKIHDAIEYQNTFGRL